MNVELLERVIEAGAYQPPRAGMLGNPLSLLHLEPVVNVHHDFYEVWGRYSDEFLKSLQKTIPNDWNFDEKESGKFLRAVVKLLRQRLDDGRFNGNTLKWEFKATPKAREVFIELGLLTEDAPVPEEEVQEEPVAEKEPPVRRKMGIERTSERVRLLFGKLHIPFEKDEEFQNKVKALPDAAWDREKRECIVPETGAAAKVLAGLGLAKDDPAPDYSVLEGLGLYPFQMDGVKSLCEKRLCRILNDPPRSGKTAQVIGAVLAMGAMPCVVLCTKKKAAGWMKDLGRFAPNARIMRIGREYEKPHDEFHSLPFYDETDFYICEFESLKEYGEALIGARCFIVDECHKLDERTVLIGDLARMAKIADYLKARIQRDIKKLDEFADDREFRTRLERKKEEYKKFLSRIFHAQIHDKNGWRMKKYKEWQGLVWRILEKAYYRLFVSGYQIEKKPTKFYEILKFLCPDRIGSFRDFGNKYCDTSPSDWAPTGFTYYGGVNMEELLDLVRSVFVGRKTGEIEGQFPKKKKGK